MWRTKRDELLRNITRLEHLGLLTPKQIQMLQLAIDDENCKVDYKPTELESGILIEFKINLTKKVDY